MSKEEFVELLKKSEHKRVNRCKVNRLHMQFTAIIKKDDETSLYVAWCPELDIASQGKNMENEAQNKTK